MAAPARIHAVAEQIAALDDSDFADMHADAD